MIAVESDELIDEWILSRLDFEAPIACEVVVNAMPCAEPATVICRTRCCEKSTLMCTPHLNYWRQVATTYAMIRCARCLKRHASFESFAEVIAIKGQS